jgi:phosphopantothenoylcysteine decarboxylase / phosphopantothenate---cysteine ligase
MLSGKHIVLGVSGSIAAYKAVYLARLLGEAQAEVWPVLTRSAARFVGPLTFSSITGNRAVVDLWQSAAAGEIGHVELAHKADAVVVAPTTADLLARLAQGRADEPITAIALSTRAKLIIAPAMEDGMWNHEATREHVVTLVRRGAHIVAPTSGELASGRVGAGRLPRRRTSSRRWSGSCRPRIIRARPCWSPLGQPASTSIQRASCRTPRAARWVTR